MLQDNQAGEWSVSEREVEQLQTEILLPRLHCHPWPLGKPATAMVGKACWGLQEFPLGRHGERWVRRFG